LYGGSRASGDRLRYRDSVEIHWILGAYGVTTVPHRLPWCLHRGVFLIGCDPAGGVTCQEGHNFHVQSLDSCTNIRHDSRDNVGRNTLGNLRPMLPKLVCNASSYHVYGEHCIIRSRR
jgi:hypothetical protein